MDALRAVIVREGLSVPSYDAIAHEGGMSRQLVRHYYRAPEEMASDLAAHLTRELHAEVEKAMTAAGERPRVDALLDALFAWDEAGFGGPDERNALECALHTLARRSPMVRDGFAAHLAAVRRMILNEVAEAEDATGIADAVSALVMARNLPGADPIALRAAAGRLVELGMNGG